MDDKHRRLFIEVASAIGSPGVFRRDGGSLREFQEDFVTDGDSAQEIATKIIEYFCLDGKSYNGFQQGVQLALGFLDVAVPQNDRSQRGQALKDLKGLLIAGDVKAIRQWVESNYP